MSGPRIGSTRSSTASAKTASGTTPGELKCGTSIDSGRSVPSSLARISSKNASRSRELRRREYRPGIDKEAFAAVLLDLGRAQQRRCGYAHSGLQLLAIDSRSEQGRLAMLY